MKNKYFFIVVAIITLATIQTGLYAQTNIAPQATVTASTCNTGACSTLNDLNFGTCGTQQMWISTNTPPSTNPGDNYIQWDWPNPVSFDNIIIHHAQTGTRFLAGATIQNWDGSQWVTIMNFSNLPNTNCSNTVTLPAVLTTSRFRFTSFLMSGSQLSNPNFREIEIIDAPPPNISKDPPSPNFQFTLGLDTLWVNSFSTLVNTSANAAKSYWNITQYQAGSTSGPWQAFSNPDPLQCNPYGCFIDTVKNNPNFSYNFDKRGFYKVALTAVNQYGVNTIEKVVFVDTPATKPTASFFATRRALGTSDRIQMNNLSSNAPARIKWWVVNECENCGADSNRFLPSDSAFHPVFAAYTSGTYKVCLAVSNTKGSDTLCRSQYLRIGQGYLMNHSEAGRADSVGRDDMGYLFSDQRLADGTMLSGSYEPTQNLTTGFRIAPCADTIYLTLERLRLRGASMYGQGDSIYVRLNGYNGPIVRRWGGNNINAYKDSVKVYKHIGQSLYVTMTLASVATTQPATVADSGFTLKWTSSPAQYPKPIAAFSCPDTLYSGYNVRFVNQSQGNLTAYSWDLNNDGAYGTDKPAVGVDSITLSPSITFFTNTPTTRKVCLKTFNCRGNDTFCKVMPLLPIQNPPVALFTVDRSIGFLSDTFRFVDKTTNGALNWKWRFEPNNVTWLAGTDSTSQYPLVSLNAAQYYTVTLIATNPLGSSQITRSQIVQGIDYGSPNSAFPPVTDATDFGISRVVIKGSNTTIDTITPLKIPTYTRLFPDLKTVMYRGGTYSIDVYRQTAEDEMSLRIWADFNRDADYTDNGENILAENNTKKIKTSLTFTVPASASIGNSRILIGACNNISSISPVSATVGVYEDYGMIIGNDFTRPNIKLVGPSSISTEINKSFNDPGVIAYDNIQGDITGLVQTISDVDNTHLGNYLIKYFVTDMYGNTSDTLVRTVQVVINQTGPTIVKSGADSISLEVFSTYAEPGCYAADNQNQPLTHLIQVTGSVNTSVVGYYTLTYSITDAYGLTATTKRVVRVMDTQKPVLRTFSGKDTVIHQIGTPFEDAKYIEVSDNYWHNILPNRNGILNTNLAGLYYLQYQAVDGSGNISDVKGVFVMVTNLQAPVLQLIGAEQVIVPVFGQYNDLGVTAKDYKGSDIGWTSNLGEVLRLDTIMDCVVTYSATDEFGITSTVSRRISVRDIESPVIELLGDNPVVWPLGKPYVDPGVKVTDNFDGVIVTNITKQDGQGIQVKIDDSKVNVNGGGFYYTVYITAKDGSGNPSEERKRVVYISTTGVEEVQFNQGFTVYPNPASQILNIALIQGKLETAQAFDMQGKSVEFNAQYNNNGCMVDISKLNAGIYLLKLQSANGMTYSGKFTVTR